jgi:hypothetical protein
MRLLNTETLRLKKFDQEPLPAYAILSHRWGDQEISFQELQSNTGTEKEGYQKIVSFCNNAKSRGFEWCWVDTCGIDKTSSAELSEAINSMYKWYEQSAVCFVFLPDVANQVGPDGSTSFTGFDKSCWFTRGWTLQELIAPSFVEFYTSDWIYIGDKRSKADIISDITGIAAGVLLGGDPVRASSVARIMSWASKRVTTRKEDIAYCLLGLFGIHMPLLYGEGDRGFIRLQEEILKQSSDQSLFAWNPTKEMSSTSSTNDSFCGILAPSPLCFSKSKDIQSLPEHWNTESTLTNRGVRLRMPFISDHSRGSLLGILCCKSSSHPKNQYIAIELYSASPHLFEDMDHLIRRSDDVIYGNWSEDWEVKFKQVYLATETALWRTRYFGLLFLKPEPEFHVLLYDNQNFVDGAPELYPPGALIGESVISFKEAKGSRKVIVLNPFKSESNRVVILLHTKLSQNVALVIGFGPQQSFMARGSLPSDVEPWNFLALIGKDQSLEEAWSNTGQPPWTGFSRSRRVTIDDVTVHAEIGQKPWWSKVSREVFIYFSSDSDGIENDRVGFPKLLGKL